MANDFYNKNPLLKGIGKKINYTEEQLKEFLLCKDEPIYFIKKYCKIISLDHEEPINFDLFDYQKRFLTSIHDNRKVVSLQPRQMGKCLGCSSILSLQITIDNIKYQLQMSIEDLHKLYKCESSDEAEKFIKNYLEKYYENNKL